MPISLRQRGITSQAQLVMAILPYLEWVKYENLCKIFWKYIDHHHDDHTLRSLLCDLKRRGMIEKKYQGTPPVPTNSKNAAPFQYLYIRRVTKPPSFAYPGSKAKLEGTYGIKAEKERARRARTKKKPIKHTMKNLTVDDYKFIRDNPHDMGERETGEMFNIATCKVHKIRHGYIPAHLRGLLAR